ncbi:hypothetical protein M0R36_10885 [bacterium]|jgi:hypothetical protein|nr:hypothetical protein [bacterium]
MDDEKTYHCPECRDTKPALTWGFSPDGIVWLLIKCDCGHTTAYEGAGGIYADHLERAMEKWANQAK